MDVATGQSRVGSLAEALANVLAGYCVALVAQQLLFPLFGFEATLAQHGAIAGAFTLVSLLRSYLLRRLFDHMDHRRRQEEAARQERLRRAFRRGRL